MNILINIEDMSEYELSTLKDLLQCMSIQSEVNDHAQQEIEEFEEKFDFEED